MSKWLSIELSLLLLVSLVAFAGFASLQNSGNGLTGFLTEEERELASSKTYQPPAKTVSSGDKSLEEKFPTPQPIKTLPIIIPPKETTPIPPPLPTKPQPPIVTPPKPQTVSLKCGGIAGKSCPLGYSCDYSKVPEGASDVMGDCIISKKPTQLAETPKPVDEISDLKKQVVPLLQRLIALLEKKGGSQSSSGEGVKATGAKLASQKISSKSE